MPAEGRRPALACIGGTECRPKAGTGARSARPKAGTPVPVRALSACWVIFIDHDCIKAKPESFAAFQKEMTPPGFKEELEKARDNPKSKEAGKLIQRLVRFITMSGVKVPSPECDAFNEADLNLPHLGLARCMLVEY